jgi:mannan polymerase II complex MNN10 subunit
MDFEASDPMGVMWHKFKMAERLIDSGKFDWLLWVDFDTLFTNTSTRVEEIIEFAKLENPDVGQILTPDW